MLSLPKYLHVHGPIYLQDILRQVVESLLFYPQEANISSSWKSIYSSAHVLAYCLIVLCYKNLDRTHHMQKNKIE